MAVYGYASVSTDGQTLEAQQAALNAVGCAKIFAEKVSGVITDRKALAKAIDALSKGDTLVVTRLDGLRGICSIRSMPSQRKARASSHWPTSGRTRQRRTAG